MYMQRLPGGLCFAPGPYTEMHCPQSPICVVDPKQDQWINLAFKQRKQHALLQAAILLEEENLLSETDAQLRQKAEEFG